MKIALCNEVLQPMPFAAQCEFAARLGYDGLELAPFTVSAEPHLLSAAERARIRADAAAVGIEITGLHWLLVTPQGLSITTPDAALHARTIEVMRSLVLLCADLGGSVLVHGSPAQRRIAPGEDRATATARAADAFAAVAETAERCGVTYCIEPLSARGSQIINTVAEAAAIVDAIASRGLRTMIDCSAAGAMEAEPVAALIDRWMPSGRIAHIQVNDPNRRGPGQGEARFAEVFAALRRQRYAGVVAAEPFDYVPDGPACAARAIGYIRGLVEGLDG